MPRTIKTDDNNYLKALLKLIPSEIVAVNIFLQGMIPDEIIIKLIVSIVLILITPFYLRFAMEVKDLAQLIISTISAVIWFYSLGNFTFTIFGFEFYKPMYGSIVIVIWSLVPPMFMYKKKN